jgi:hypothetical protein
MSAVEAMRNMLNETEMKVESALAMLRQISPQSHPSPTTAVEPLNQKESVHT